MLSSLFKVEHSGVSNPSLFLNCREFKGVKATFVIGLRLCSGSV